MAHLKLERATSFTISYMLDDETRTFEIAGEKARALASTLEITGRTDGDSVGLVPFGRVQFHLPDAQTVKTFFVKPEQIETDGGSAIYLKRTFYDMVCEEASADAGRHIDVLRRN